MLRTDQRNAHVTRLPNGRVLKGTPDEQHKKAEFWTEIAQESDELVKQVESTQTQKASTETLSDLPTAAPTKRKNKFSHSPSQ